MFQNGCFSSVVIKLLWLLVLKICFEKLATMGWLPWAAFPGSAWSHETAMSLQPGKNL